MKKPMVLSPQRRANVTSVVPLQRKPLDKKVALKNKVQDILSGRSRFVIRKVPATGSTRGQDSSSGGQATSNGQEKETQVHSSPSVSRSNEEAKKDRCCVFIFSIQFSNTRSSLKALIDFFENVLSFCIPIWYVMLPHQTDSAG